MIPDAPRTETCMPAFPSSTREIPQVKAVPRHIAIIMDGNGRWAKQRMLPRAAGHRRGVESVRETVKGCASRGVEYLTLFAFSSENWRRPAEEVSMLKQLFIMALEREAEKLHANGIRLRVVGDLAPFGKKITDLVERAERLTQANKKMTLTIAANYGGRWDLLQAVQRLVESRPEQRGVFTEEQLAGSLVMGALAWQRSSTRPVSGWACSQKYLKPVFSNSSKSPSSVLLKFFGLGDGAEVWREVERHGFRHPLVVAERVVDALDAF